MIMKKTLAALVFSSSFIAGCSDRDMQTGYVNNEHVKIVESRNYMDYFLGRKKGKVLISVTRQNGDIMTYNGEVSRDEDSYKLILNNAKLTNEGGVTTYDRFSADMRSMDELRDDFGRYYAGLKD